MTDIDRDNHTYLGDGVYAESTPEHIILRTGDHRDTHCDNIIYLEQDILINLVEWLTQLKRINKPSIIRNVDMSAWLAKLGKAADKIMIDALEEAQRLSENHREGELEKV